MGKPTNMKTERCSHVSSNCVIWQGPDIECLNICNGDTISDVFFQLACLVCTIKKQLDVESYDLTCLDIASCDLPTSYIELFQIVIDKLCSLQDQISNGESGTETAIDIVSVASCFSAELGPTATLSNYIQAIGQKVCEQDLTIQNQQQAILQLVSRVEYLESLH